MLNVCELMFILTFNGRCTGRNLRKVSTCIHDELMRMCVWTNMQVNCNLPDEWRQFVMFIWIILRNVSKRTNLQTSERFLMVEICYLMLETQPLYNGFFFLSTRSRDHPMHPACLSYNQKGGHRQK